MSRSKRRSASRCDPGHLEVVPGDAGEAGVAGVAQLEDALERGRAPVELRERGHRVGLVEVEHLGVEQAPRVVSNCSVTPSGLARRVLPATKNSLPVRRQVRAHHRLGRPVLRRDVEVVHAVVEGQPHEVPGLLRRGRPTGRAAEHGHAAVVPGPPEAAALHRRAAQPLSAQDVEDGADVVGQHGEASRLDVGRAHEHRAAELLRLGHAWRRCRPPRSRRPSSAASRPACRRDLSIMPPTDRPASFHSV